MTLTFTDHLDDADLPLLHSWLSQTYWTPGIPFDMVERVVRNSTVCMVAREDGRMVGFGRAISDTIRFGYLADIYVTEDARGRGIGRGIVEHLMRHPKLCEVYVWHLHTKDAHGVYEKLGFTAFDKPERSMTLRKSRPW